MNKSESMQHIITAMPSQFHQAIGLKERPATKRNVMTARGLHSVHGLQDTPDETKVFQLPMMPDVNLDTMTGYANQKASAYVQKLETLLYVNTPGLDARMPVRMPSGPGWWKYAGNVWEPSGCPSGQVTVLDFETTWHPDAPDVWFPVCCACYGPDGLYLWLVDTTLEKPSALLPFTEDNLIVAWNASYDRSFLEPEYKLAGTQNRFWDAMSAWIACRGITNQQRTALFDIQKRRGRNEWSDRTTTNGLDAVYKFFFPGRTLDKGVRSEIVDNGWPWVRRHLAAVSAYCVADIKATLDVINFVLPEWLEAQPSPVNIFGQIELGSMYVPLSADRWPEYPVKADACVAAITARSEAILMEKTQALVEAYKPSLLEVLAEYKAEIKGIAKVSKPTAEQKAQAKEHKTAVMARLMDAWKAERTPDTTWLDWTPALSGKNAGLPAWYRKLMADGYGVSKRWATAVLGLTWNDKPIYWEGDGKTGGFVTAEGPIPHPEERGKRVICMFTKGFTKAAEKGVLGSSAEGISDMVKDFASAALWRSLRDRVVTLKTHSPEGFPVAIPRISVTGAITRRCKDNLFQVLSNPKEKRIASEMKSMVEAPPGWCIVGANVATEEAKLAAFLGDVKAGGAAGITPFSYSVLVGDKDLGTDFHTLNSKKCGISRDDAKIPGFSCVPYTTEVMTRDGWVTRDKLSVGVEVLSYDADIKQNVWTPVLATHDYPEAEVFEVTHGHTWAVQATGNHRWYVEQRRTRKGQPRFWEPGVRTTNQINGETNIINAAPCHGKPLEDVSTKHAAIFGWILTDGYHRWGEVKTATSAQGGKKRRCEATIYQKKAEQCEELEILLDGISTEGKPDKNGTRVWYVRPWFMRQLWTEVGLEYGSEDYPRAIRRMSYEAREAFIDAYYKAEGWLSQSGTKCYSQNEGPKLEALTTALTLNGYKFTTTRETSYTGKVHASIRVSPRTHTTGQRLTKTSVGVMPVWCITTATGSFVMRQGDTVTITGNSLYGVGVKGLTDYFIKLNPKFSVDEASALARAFLSAFKGERDKHGHFVGGLASEAFNMMTSIAGERQPRTPMLEAALSKALAGIKDYATTRLNWVVQSSGSDIRDCLVVFAKYFIDRLGLDARLMLTIHDEVRYLVKNGQEKAVAWCLQMAHMFSWALWVKQLGLDCLPASTAWFPSVDVDTVLRKEPWMPCTTPSQTEAIPPGYGLLPSDLLDFVVPGLPVAA